MSMALHIRDARTEEAVRELARSQGSTLTEAVRVACEEKLAREQRKMSARELLADIHAEIRALPRTGEKADKAFFDELWGEND
jgi:antitoxin VapB